MTTESGFDIESAGYDPGAPLTPSGNLRRRNVVNRIFEGGATGAALLAVGVLGIVTYSVVRHGGHKINWSFITTGPPPTKLGQFTLGAGSASGGGIAPAIVGTLEIVTVATIIAMPLGILIALYLTEFAPPRVARAARLVLDLINGLPTIVVGLFVFGLLVVGHHQSGFAAAVALAVIMLPLIARGSQEVLLLVPGTLRDAADALGVARRRTVLGVILPTALGGILTSTILAVARAAGETAPLILLSSIAADNTYTLNIFGGPVPNIPIAIFQASESADPAGFERAWGAAFVLLGAILIVSIAGRTLLARSRSKLAR
jgi:phosphate transport system permease protein